MKRLDRVQTGCLRNMVTNSGGHWRADCGWDWQSPFKTEKVFEGLVARGLVVKTGTHKGYGTFTLTPTGRKVADAELVSA